MSPADSELIDEFCDALWLEDGLAKLSLEAYRRDLAQLAAWLAVLTLLVLGARWTRRLPAQKPIRAAAPQPDAHLQRGF